ncbi:MAG: MFS transporter [Burkholderiales bacterium RIFCSPLOWO2_02_FULL_57_36]|nr:MAG: MFS transporter [Burkholderiales bacterium RIFCSPLOWO2_02_FULL_57_36]
MNRSWKTPLAIVVCGGIIMGLSLGVRHVQGLFLLPMTIDRGWTREDFALALALQNLVWGLLMPFTGMIADKFGTAKVLLGGCLCYALGLYLMAYSTSSLELLLTSGVIIGAGLSATSFGTVYGALSRLVAPERRGWALGLAGAVGGLGQFAMVPAAQIFISGFGWLIALVILAGVMLAAVPLSGALAEPANLPRAGQQDQSLREALGEAFSHKGFWLLNLGFLACGFQLAFIAGHLPAYLMDKGMNGRNAVIALSLIALANIAGTYYSGILGTKYRRKHLLAYNYLARSVAIAAFVMLPLSEWTLYGFSIAMGLLWLGTAPLTNGLVSQVFGVKYLTTLFGFVFVGHQVGGFMGAWLGGVVFDVTGSYDLVWLGAIGLGLIAAALHWPIDDRQLARLQTT